ncbi:cryptochrome/photolyase family protein [Actinoallomurus soli]|uniref:cryptochrome/photolyase family protein n=1 Tax=Actinoallomurus soli TaxID=2952535 RepID=UPI0020922393|nr:cryptochrome/photolyase family protein [Actinoallomurus soli]MCO5971264.1 cryptochrome/photolyase family protein [Actinoallomurus soli]
MRRWLFADQLGPHFLDTPDQPVLLVESRAVLRRRRFHRRKAHLVLSALRHRASELGDQARFIRTDTYREALGRLDEPVTVCRPTSHAADAFVRSLDDVEVLPARGFATSAEEFAAWAEGRAGRRLLLEDFYRRTRKRLGVLMEPDGEPTGGRWNFDADNREPPPRNAARLDVPAPWRPREDDIDARVRSDLDAWARDGDVAFVGNDGPREFPATRDEALAALGVFVRGRLREFGRYEDAMLADDPVMAHSLLSASLNLGLLDPLECVHAAEDAYRRGWAPPAAVEGFVRQILGWREYVWHVYWHLGPGYRHHDHLSARRAMPRWFAELDADAVDARCLATVLAEVRDHGWVHHIPRLIVLGNYALQRGWRPAEVTDWFHRCFVDGYDWVMVPNVVGMALHADGGKIATKPYAAGGAYIDRMSDFCARCPYDPRRRLGDDACPFTAGYWWFLHRNAELLGRNHRMSRPLANLRGLADIDAVAEQEQDRGSDPP